jgi:DMSO reductase iron-sulfur subunit
MVIDLTACIGCQACTIACKFENGTALGVDWHRVETIGDPRAQLGQDLPRGTYPNLTMAWLPVPCQHCANPPCAQVCPTGAITQTAEGLVLVDQDRCTGCRYCSWACPYQVPQFNLDSGTMEKCTLCAHRVTQGEQPACVAACVYGARIFGDLDDPTSEAAQLIARRHARVLLAEEGTQPAIYYVGP